MYTFHRKRMPPNIILATATANIKLWHVQPQSQGHSNLLRNRRSITSHNRVAQQYLSSDIYDNIYVIIWPMVNNAYFRLVIFEVPGRISPNGKRINYFAILDLNWGLPKWKPVH
jgi:hypothetical protein